MINRDSCIGSDGLTRGDRDLIRAVLARYPDVRRVTLFGSRAMGTFGRGSDIDLALEGLGLDASTLTRIATELEDSDLPYNVDLLLRDDELEPKLDAHIRRYGKPFGWEQTTLGEIAEIFDGPHATPAKVSRGPIFLGISNLSRGRLDLTESESLSEEDYMRWTRRVEPRSGDVVFSYETRLGEAALIPEGLRCCLGRRMGLLRARPGKVNNRFLLYAYLGPQFQETLRARTIHGSTVDRIPLIDLPKFPIGIPDSIDEQCAIAGVLGALDDKIEQNRRTARALERLARAIFRAWFVDFEPVKAKAAGATSFPSMPQPVFDALSTRFVDSEIGPVPEGWEVKAIGEVVTVKGGGTPSTKNPEYWDDGEHCWATPKDMSRLSHPVLLDTERHITDAGVEKISSGILPTGTVLMSSRAPVGYLAIVGVPTAINQGFIAMVCDGLLPPTYVLNWAFTSLDMIKAHASGTTFAEISKKNFRPLPVVQSIPDVIAAYQKTVDPLFDLLTACVVENERLAQMRNYLLPKLLSGGVRVHDAERQIVAST